MQINLHFLSKMAQNDPKKICLICIICRIDNNQTTPPNWQGCLVHSPQGRRRLTSDDRITGITKSTCSGSAILQCSGASCLHQGRSKNFCYLYHWLIIILFHKSHFFKSAAKVRQIFDICKFLPYFLQLKDYFTKRPVASYIFSPRRMYI